MQLLHDHKRIRYQRAQRVDDRMAYPVWWRHRHGSGETMIGYVARSISERGWWGYRVGGKDGWTIGPWTRKMAADYLVSHVNPSAAWIGEVIR